MPVSKKKKYLLFTAALFILCICAIFIYIKKQFSSKEPASIPLQSATKSPQKTPSAANTDSQEKKTKATAISNAFHHLLEQPGFEIQTNAEIELNGKLIKGKQTSQSTIAITNALQEDKMQMSLHSVSTSEKKSQKTNAYYYQGWYCCETSKKCIRTKKTPDNVLSMVSFLSTILEDASQEATNLKISKTGSDTVYQFSLPKDCASTYFCQLIERASLETKELKNVTGEVHKINITCIISKNNLLKKQTVSIYGKVSKSIFSIPTVLKASSDFTIKKDTFRIDPPDLKKYKIVSPDKI